MHDLHLFQNLVDHFFPFRCCNAKIQEREFDVFEHRQLIDQIETLKDKTDVRFPHVGPLALGIFGNLFIEKIVFDPPTGYPRDQRY